MIIFCNNYDTIIYYVQKTPLSTACYYGHHEIVKFLLDKGAVVDKSCMKFAVEKVYRYYNIIYMLRCCNIIQLSSVGLLCSYTARVLLRSPEWRKCLQQTLQSGEPIMNDIIRKMPGIYIRSSCYASHKSHWYCDSDTCTGILLIILEVAADVFDKCTVQCEKKSEKEGCVAFDFEFLECFNEGGYNNIITQ